MRMHGTLERDVELLAPITLGEKKFKKLIIREVVGFDEEAISQPRFKANPAGIFYELIARCTAEVSGTEELPNATDIKRLPVGQIDLLIMDVRRVSVGDEYEIKTNCPNGNCKKPYEDVITLDDVAMKPGSFADVKLKLERGIVIGEERVMEVIVKPVDGILQERFVGRKDTTKFGEINSELIGHCLRTLDGKTIPGDSISGMSRIDRKKVDDTLKKFPGPDVARKLTCRHCGEEFEYNLNMLGFLA